MLANNSPKANSTPKHVVIRRRPPINRTSTEWKESPIYNSENIPEGANHDEYSYEELSDDENPDMLDSCDEDDESKQNTANTKMCNCLNPFVIVIAIVFVILIILGKLNGTKVDTEKIITFEESLEKLSKDFPSQVEDFWLYVQVGVKDIMKFQHPKTLLFLYNDQSHITAEKLLNKISELGTCALTNCKANPVVLEGSRLNTTDILEDYGKIIANNKKNLEESGVMIIKNLEKIPGASAQAFHSFCDEINPVVQKALFLFTMKVDQFPENNAEFVEQYLHHLWSDIKDDKFYPLFTRISHVILPIKMES